MRRVRVYQDPLTRKELEGEAIVIEVVSEEVYGDPNYKLIECGFPEDSDSHIVTRIVHVDDFTGEED